ncbi:MAG: PD40 domain-containing protein, partial [Polyangiaceae bacterium]|nr:PD40 domain-containing protein [Polyangiaceae bacterium]
MASSAVVTAVASSANRADPARPGLTAPRPGPTGFVAFVSERQPERDVYLVAAAGGPAERLTTAPGDDYPAAVSPDRRTLVTVRAETRADGAHRERLELLVALGEREREARPVFEARELTSPSGRWRNPVWLPDAGAVVAESDRDGFVALYRVPLDGRAPERLTDDRTGSFDPSVDPRGAFVAFASSRDGDAELYRLELGSRELRRLTWSEGDDATPRFAPDGSAIAYTSLRRGAFRAYLMGPDGAHPRPLLGAADAAEGAETGFLAH